MTSNSEDNKEEERVVDVRSLSPPARHSHIMKVFEEMRPSETLLVVNDHEPVHLVKFMKHERKDFDLGSYRAYRRGPQEWVGVFKKKKEPQDDLSKRKNDRVIVTSFDKERVLDDSAFSPVPVYTSEDYRVILAYFKAGQFIPVHTPNIDLVLLVHSGKGEVVAGDVRMDVKAGDLIVVPKGEKRGVRAISDMEVLHLVSPPPNDSDHEEVAKKLSQGVFC
jgi:quercetin dioxygenase-like cupin family protein